MGSVDVGKRFQDDPCFENHHGNREFWALLMARSSRNSQSTERSGKARQSASKRALGAGAVPLFNSITQVAFRVQSVTSRNAHAPLRLGRISTKPLVAAAAQKLPPALMHGVPSEVSPGSVFARRSQAGAAPMPPLVPSGLEVKSRLRK